MNKIQDASSRLNFYKKLARSKGGDCLSLVYTNAHTKLTWQCAEGHKWDATPDGVRQGCWCPCCGGKQRLSISKMKNIAMSRGGDCISTDYLNNRTKLRWVCSVGHEWDAVPSAVLQGSWCPFCAKKARLNIGVFQEIAKARGGECLSDVYENINRKLKWRCAAGHEWEAKADGVKNSGSWCPICASKRIDNPIQYVQELALIKGGRCLSETYVDSKSKLLWECSLGHRWLATLNDVGQGAWSHDCGGSKALTLEAVRISAAEKGGECLSNEYLNSHTKMRWRCDKGHEWSATAGHIRSGGWCPVCSSGNSERICRAIFEQMFKKAFPKIKPFWLINSRGNRMELDGYCEDLKLAFEYHGAQHYKHNSFFHRDDNSLSLRRQDDLLKSNLCKMNGINLIEVPFFIAISDMPTFIYDAASCLSINAVRPEDIVVPTFISKRLP